MTITIDTLLESCGNLGWTSGGCPVNEMGDTIKRSAKLIAGHTAASAVASGAFNAALKARFDDDVDLARSKYERISKKKNASKEDKAAARKAYHRAQAKAALRGFGSGAKYGAITGLGTGTSHAILDKTRRDLGLPLS